MSERGYKIRDQHATHFITFAVIEWIDVFTRSIYADIVVESLRFCQQNKGMKVHAWCLMSNHIHLIISATPPASLSGLIRDFKKFTSSQIIQAIENNEKESRKNWMLWMFRKAGERNKRNDNYQFWQQDNHPIECSTPELLKSRMRYLHENPLRAGIVRNEWNYVYSSAADYYNNGEGMIKIDFI